MKRSRNSLIGGLMAATLALAVLWFNPIQGLSKYVSEEFYLRSIASAYPLHRPNTLLVLANDRTLAAAAHGDVERDWSSWPLPLSAWSAALDQAQARSARMVLLDIGLIDRRDPAAERALLDVLRLVAQTVEVFIVDPGPQPTGETLAAWLVRNAGSSRVHLVSPERAPASGFSTTYLLKAQHLRSPMAAVAMARWYCREPGVRCAAGQPRADRIELWWPSPECALGSAVGGGCSGRWSALGRAGALVFRQTFSGVCENLPGVLRCGSLPPLVSSGYAVDAMSLEDFTNKAPARTGAEKLDAVVISQDFDLAQDVIASPVYGDTPGAHAHAVAFDNLVTLGEGAITRAYPFGLGENVFLSLWIVAALLAGHCLRTGLRRRSARGAEERRARWRDVLDRFTPVIVIATMLFLFFAFCFAWSVSPANWLAAYAAIGIGWQEESRIELHVRSFLIRRARHCRRPLARRVALCLARRR